MKIKDIIPPPAPVLREGLIVLGGLLIAAFIISRFPALKKFVTENSLTVNDSQGNNVW